LTEPAAAELFRVRTLQLRVQTSVAEPVVAGGSSTLESHAELSANAEK
jgi:hypothetical protein